MGASSNSGESIIVEGLEPISPVSMNEAIQKRLRQFIRDQGLSPSDRLPSENRLANSLGVSRNALREALRSLEALGMVDARVGSGWYVREMTFDAVTDALVLNLELSPQTLDGLYQVRDCLECAFIEDAVQALTEEDLDSLRDLVGQMDNGASSDEDLLQVDRAFHKTLYAGLNNPVLDSLIDVFFQIVKHERRQYPRKSPAEMAREHAAILDAVSCGDAEAARRILHEAFQAYLFMANGNNPI